MRYLRRAPSRWVASRLGAILSWWFAFTRDPRRERTFTTKQREAYAESATPHLHSGRRRALRLFGPAEETR